MRCITINSVFKFEPIICQTIIFFENTYVINIPASLQNIWPQDVLDDVLSS